MSTLIDAESLIEQAISANLDTSVFEFDDNEVPKAANSIEWCLGANFLSSTLFTKQAEVLIHLFMDFCPRCSDEKYLDAVPVGGNEAMADFCRKVKLLEHGLCPNCKKNRIELFDTIPEEFVGVWGQRSGKSVIAGSKIATYMLHRYLKIPNVARYFYQDPSTQFDFVFVAITAGQAESSLWSKFHNTVATAPWFTDYHRFLKRRKTQVKSRVELFDVKNTLIRYGGSKGIVCKFKASNLRTLRGDTRIFGAIDELGWFDQKQEAERANAEEVYTSISNSLRTLRSAAREHWRRGDFDSPTALMVNISSPSSAWDKIMRLVKLSEQDKTKVCSHLATWEVNPQLKREDFRSEEITSPVKFWRDFGAVPPLANEPFIGASHNLERIQHAKTQPMFRASIDRITDSTGFGNYVGPKLVKESIRQDRMTPRILTVDAGETENSFSIGMYSAIWEKDDPCIVTDGIIAVHPEKDPAGESAVPVHFPTCFEVITELCKLYSIKYVVWDRWQSTGEVQRLRDLGIKAERYSLRFEDFQLLRSKIWGGRVRLPVPEMAIDKLGTFDPTNVLECQKYPWTSFYCQIATVREVGKKVAKPVAGDDDLWRTLALASHYILHPKLGLALKHDGKGRMALSTRGVRGTVVGYSSGSSTKGSGLVKGMAVRTRSR